MSTSSADERRTRAAAEAADWVLRLESEHLSASERGEFVDWLRESPLHVAEMLRIGRLSSALATFHDWDRIAPGGDLGDNRIIRLGIHGTAVTARRRVRIVRSKWVAGVAAALVLFTASGWLLHRQFSQTTIHTLFGESREVVLSDGSVIRLSGNTNLQVRFQRHIRAVSIERGDATFRVAKDKGRPFVVTAASARVTAVGTVFSVSRNGDLVVVTVTEGRVKVMPAADSGDAPGRAQRFPEIILQANERVSVSAEGAAGPVHRVEDSPASGWGENKLVFENTRVGDVIAQFNRVNRIQIRVTDDVLNSRTVSGVFAANDPRSFVQFLQAVAGAASVDNGTNEIVVTPVATGAGPSAPLH